MALIAASTVDAGASVLTWSRLTVVNGVKFAQVPGRSRYAVALETVQRWFAFTSILTRKALTVDVCILAEITGGTRQTKTSGTVAFLDTQSSILTRLHVTERHLRLAVTSRPSVFADAPVVVDQLNAVLKALTVTRVRQTFIDVTFALCPYEPRLARTLVATDAVDARSAVVARRIVTVIFVDFAQPTLRAWRTRTSERVDEVMARASILTGFGRAFVDVVFAVGTLVTAGTRTGVIAGEVFARRTIQARLRLTFVDIIFAVAAVKTWLALAAV